jgi:hypothetical protein
MKAGTRNLSAAFLQFNFRLSFPGPITLSAVVNGIPTASAMFASEGEQSYTIKLPREALKASLLRFDFTVDKCLPSGDFDERELALLVPFWRPGLDNPDSNLPFQLS